MAAVVGVMTLTLSGVISFGGASQAPSAGERSREEPPLRPRLRRLSQLPRDPALAKADEAPAEASLERRTAAKSTATVDAPELAAALATDGEPGGADRFRAGVEEKKEASAKSVGGPRPARDEGRFDPAGAPAAEESAAAEGAKLDSGLVARKGGGAPADLSKFADDKSVRSADLDDSLGELAGVGQGLGTGRGAGGLSEGDSRGPAAGKAGAGDEYRPTAPSQELQARRPIAGLAGEPAPGTADARELEQSERFLKSRSARASPPSTPPPPPAAVEPPKVAATKRPDAAAEPSVTIVPGSGGSPTGGAPAPTAAAQAAPAPPPSSSPAAGYFGKDAAEESREDLAVAAGGARREAPHGSPVVRKNEDPAEDAKESKARRIAVGGSSMSNAIDEIDQAEALFREAERLSGAQRKAEAVKIFLRVAREYPSTLRARQALYSAWLIELDRGNDAVATELLSELAQRYPGSPELQRARSRSGKKAEEKRVESPSPKKKAAPARQQNLDLESDYNQAPAAAAPEPALPPAKAATEQAY